jgi:hypothetical protein
VIAADFRSAAKRTSGTGSTNLSALAAHYDAQVTGSDAAFAGRKPVVRRVLSARRREHSDN